MLISACLFGDGAGTAVMSAQPAVHVRRVPALAAKHVESLLTEMLGRYPRMRAEVTGWILQAVGREVLTALQKSLGLSEGDVRLSADILLFTPQ